MKIFLIIWRLFLYTADSLLLLNSVSPKNPSAKKKVLIMRLDSIGDFILWLDCAKEYSNIFPEKDFKLTLLGNIIWKDIADNLPFFDSFIFFERKKFLRNLFYRYGLLKKIRDEGFDVVIQARCSREFIVDDAIIRTSKAQERIGLEGDSANIQKWKKRISRKWYTKLVKTSKKNLPELLRNEELVHALGATNFKAGLPRLQVNKNTLNSFKELPDEYYILAPGTRDHWKKWSAQKFSLLADKIYSCCNLTGIICGSLSEQTISSQIINRSSSRLLDFTGLTSLPDLIAMIKNACFLVSNDSAAIHIAAAVNTPSLCILGGGHYGRFIPYDKSASSRGTLPVPVICRMDCFGCDWKNKSCKQHNSVAPCIEKISVDDVWIETQKIIETYKQNKYKMYPFFSIITASLNNAASIERTLKSIKNQTFKELEHIVIDGGSTDKTLEVLRTFKGNYNLSYISEPDSGIAAALNKGLKKAKGNYILVIQADDYLPDLHMLENIYPLLKNEDIDIYSFPIIMNQPKKGKIILKPIKLKWWNRFKFIFLHQGTFVHKRVYKKVGNFSSNYSIAMDYDFFYRALKEQPAITFGDFPVAEMSGSGISSSTEHLAKRLKEEALVQTANETNIFWKSVQTIFRLLYIPYKTRLLPILKKDKR